MEPMNADILRISVFLAHDPCLVANDVVVQIWSDGSITSQKAGLLFDKGTLHYLLPPLPSSVPGLSPEGFPRKARGASNAFVSFADAVKLRAMMCHLAEV